jgi:predicted metalloprotease
MAPSTPDARPLRAATSTLAAAIAFASFLVVTAPVASAQKTLAQSSGSAATITPFEPFTATYSDELRTVAADLDAFWAAELPRIYNITYEPLAGYFPSDPATVPPRCGRRIRYRDVAGNAFYCGQSDYIAFDNASLFPRLNRQIGTVALHMVLAHEMGHAVQARIGSQLPSVYAELQADCFAGAWLRRYTDGRVNGLTPNAESMEQATIAALSFRDQPGLGANRVGAHGNGFDRVSSLQLGYDQGTDRCAAFRTDPPAVTAASFRTAAEAATGGDIDINDAVALTVSAAKQHFTPMTGTVQIGRSASDRELESAYATIGDLGLSMLLLRDWTTAATTRLWREEASQAQRELRTICLAGSWLGAAQRGALGTADSPISLSPGDLDEALIATIRADGVTRSFDRARALRTGFETSDATLSTVRRSCSRL